MGQPFSQRNKNYIEQWLNTVDRFYWKSRRHRSRPEEWSWSTYLGHKAGNVLPTALCMLFSRDCSHSIN